MDNLISGAGPSRVVIPHGLAEAGCKGVRVDRRDRVAGNGHTRRDVARNVVSAAMVQVQGRDDAPPDPWHDPRVVGGKG